MIRCIRNAIRTKSNPSRNLALGWVDLGALLGNRHTSLANEARLHWLYAGTHTHTDDALNPNGGEDEQWKKNGGMTRCVFICAQSGMRSEFVWESSIHNKSHRKIGKPQMTHNSCVQITSHMHWWFTQQLNLCSASWIDIYALRIGGVTLFEANNYSKKADLSPISIQREKVDYLLFSLPSIRFRLMLLPFGSVVCWIPRMPFIL